MWQHYHRGQRGERVRKSGRPRGKWIRGFEPSPHRNARGLIRVWIYHVATQRVRLIISQLRLLACRPAARGIFSSFRYQRSVGQGPSGCRDYISTARHAEPNPLLVGRWVAFNGNTGPPTNPE